MHYSQWFIENSMKIIVFKSHTYYVMFHEVGISRVQNPNKSFSLTHLHS